MLQGKTVVNLKRTESSHEVIPSEESLPRILSNVSFENLIIVMVEGCEDEMATECVE